MTSGLGYVLWYRALPRLSVTQAAVAQVGVPVIAAAGGVACSASPLSLRLLLAGAAVLGGIGCCWRASARRRRRDRSPASRARDQATSGAAKYLLDDEGDGAAQARARLRSVGTMRVPACSRARRATTSLTIGPTRSHSRSPRRPP